MSVVFGFDPDIAIPEWLDDAPCVSYSDVFENADLDKGGDWVQWAQQICAECPFQRECVARGDYLERGIITSRGHGLFSVLAGETPVQRDQRRRAARKTGATCVVTSPETGWGLYSTPPTPGHTRAAPKLFERLYQTGNAA